MQTERQIKAHPSVTRAHSRLPVIAALVILARLLIAGVSGPFAGRLNSLPRSDLADFVPSTAEATQVLKLGRGFQSAAVVLAVIVLERPSGISAADREYVVAAAANVTGLKGVVVSASQPISSADGNPKCVTASPIIRDHRDRWHLAVGVRPIGRI